MTPIADMVEKLMKAGATPEVIIIAVRGAEENASAQRAKQRAKDAERQRRKRNLELFEAQDVVDAEPAETEKESRDIAHPEAEQKKVPTPLKKITLELPEVGSSKGASAPQASEPVYTDSKHELWGEGVAILRQLGLKDRDARSNIGRWLRDCRDDAASVLGAIQRARDNRVIEPIAWITRALQTGNIVRINGNPHEKSRQRGNVHAEISRIAADYAAAAAAEPSGEGGGNPARLLSGRGSG